MIVTGLATIAFSSAYAAGHAHLAACLISGGLFAASLAAKLALYQKRDPNLGLNVWRYHWQANPVSNALIILCFATMAGAAVFLFR